MNLIYSFECVCEIGKTGANCEIDFEDPVLGPIYWPMWGECTNPEYDSNICGREQGHGACREVAHPTETDIMGLPMKDTARSDKYEESGHLWLTDKLEFYFTFFSHCFVKN